MARNLVTQMSWTNEDLNYKILTRRNSYFGLANIYLRIGLIINNFQKKKCQAKASFVNSIEHL